MAVRREQGEVALLREVWDVGHVGNSEEGATWRACATRIVVGARTNFGEMDAEEYLVCGVLYGLRLFGYELNSVERLRVLAWISGQYKYLRKPLEAV